MNDTVEGPSRSLYKTVAVGYFLGGCLIFWLPMAVFFFPSMAAQSNIGPLKAVGFLALVPVILIMQGFLVSAMIMLGLWLRTFLNRRFRGNPPS